MKSSPAFRRWSGWALALVSAWTLGCAGFSKEAQEPLVDLQEVDPKIVLDIRYATPENFTHQKLYSVSRCLLRRSVAQRLAAAEADLAAQGLGLKVWDCYRPRSIQYKLWEIVHDPHYVADPKKGSRHNRGAAVDLTLMEIKTLGFPHEAEMPTGFDDFTVKAHADYAGASERGLRNRGILQAAMERHGFKRYPEEWWHFDADGWEKYPLMDVPLEPSFDGKEKKQ